LHLLELEDQQWLPATIRNGVTAYLNFVGNLTSAPYEEFVGVLSRAMESTGDDVLVDLCSGSLGPVPTLLRMLGKRGLKARAVLTDLYPDERVAELVRHADVEGLSYRQEPVNAMQVPPELSGFRLLCNGFHHFHPAQAQSILTDAVRNRRGIAVFEGVERRLPAVLTCAAAVFLVPLATLFIRPWRWDRALLTYALPAIPLTVAWDGIVSCLRVYSPDELRELIGAVPGASDYRWHIERFPVPRSPFGATCLVGYPAS
jgi:hypothetical protein